LSAAGAAATAPTLTLPFERCVFVNCPFDSDFLPILHAILFTIHDCGFIARIAVEDTGSSESRLDKIARIIRESRYSIHDISRVEITPASPLPRFNMAFECGLALGAIRYGTTPGRDFLFMSGVPHQDKLTLSDLAGQDAKAHRNDPKTAASAIRSFLSAKSVGSRTRGPDAIWGRYQRFTADLPRLAEKLELTLAEVQGFDLLRDFLQIAARWIEADALKLGKRRRR
jgi:hypothetical protein